MSENINWEDFNLSRDQLASTKIQPSSVGDKTLSINTTDNAVTLSVTDNTSDWYTQPIQVTDATDNTLTVTDTGALIVRQQDNDKLKSGEEEKVPKTSHKFNAVLTLKGVELVIEYKCDCCDVVLHRQVISRIPESIIKEKCLSRLVRET